MSEVSEWKRPSDVMKIHNRRKSSSQRRISTDPEKRTSVIFKSPSKSLKRKNPFYVDSPRPNAIKRQGFDKNPNNHSSGQLFSILDSANKEDRAGETDVCEYQTTQSDEVVRTDSYVLHEQLQDEIITKQTLSQTKENKLYNKDEQRRIELSPFLPVDWSLKTKLRIVSSHSLSWCTQLKSADEAYGVTSFVHESLPQLCKTEDGDNSLEKQLFHKSCLYWIHPNLPWATLFPRIIEDSKSSNALFLPDDVQKCLHADWEKSFTSVYQQLRSGLCPYFYLCTHQFTVLFHNNTKSQSSLTAFITPTTRGFRESLENEGIEFTLPVGKKVETPDSKNDNLCELTSVSDNVTSACITEKAADDVDGGDDILETDDAASGWLESMGLDKKQFPSLDPKKVKLQREGYRLIDNRPESLVYIEGPSIQAFFNFLLNCRTCVAMSGTQAGIPPTILSCMPFKGATLAAHKVKYTVIKQNDNDGHINNAHIVEVQGPILPYHYQSLVSLLHHTQSANFGMVANNHDPTIPFNILPKTLPLQQLINDAGNSDKFEEIVDGGLCTHSDTIEKLSKPGHDECYKEYMPSVKMLFKDVPLVDRLGGLKEIVCTPNGFTWTI